VPTHARVILCCDGWIWLFDIGGVIAAIGLVIAFLTAAIRTTRVLYRAEPLPSSLKARNPQPSEAQIESAGQLRQDA
jgi:hypothetical protein